MKTKRLPRLWCALQGVLPLTARAAQERVATAAKRGAGAEAAPREMALRRPPGPGTVGHGFG